MHVEMFNTSPQKCLPGVVDKINGPLYYLMILSDGRLACTHIDNIRQRYTEFPCKIWNNPNYDLYYPDLPRTVTWFEFVTNAS